VPCGLMSSSYPSGIYPSQDRNGQDLLLEDSNPGNDPSWTDGAVLEMSRNWAPIDAVVGGTEFVRRNARVFIPQEPKENDDAYKRRTAYAVLSPFTQRLAEQAAGLILRKGVQLQPKDDAAEINSVWEEFSEDVDGNGSSLDSYARRLAISSILYGHAGTLVDFPATEAAPNLAVERQLGLRPYFVHVDAKQFLGWRRVSDSAVAPLGQVRIDEIVSEPKGEFGDDLVRNIRVLDYDETGQARFRVFRRGDSSDTTGGWQIYQEGTISINKIPLAVTYSNKIAELVSKPPLLSIANLNLLHCSTQTDLSHALRVAALPILVLKGFDDTDNEIGLSANSAILMSTDGSAEYVEPVGQGSFNAQAAFIKELEGQMSRLGISTLYSQMNSPETAESKMLTRTDSDSLLSIVSKDLQASLQEALDMAGQFLGIEAPMVTISRDFDLQTLDANQVAQYLALWQNGAITQSTLLTYLRDGEILPNIDIDLEVEMTDQEKISNMAMLPQAMQDQAVAEAPAAQDDKSEDESSETLEEAAVNELAA